MRDLSEIDRLSRQPVSPMGRDVHLSIQKIGFRYSCHRIVIDDVASGALGLIVYSKTKVSTHQIIAAEILGSLCD
jgi:hypothetical protein